MLRPRLPARAARIAGLLIAASLLCSIAGVAQAGKLRRVAASTTSFATDGARYAAWQVTPASPIVVLDTRTRTKRTIPQPGCVLAEAVPGGAEGAPAVARAGRFLLACFKEPRDGCFVIRGLDTLLRCGEEPLGPEPTVAQREARGVAVQRLLDVRTGASIQLPEQTNWSRVGTRYVEGSARCGYRVECATLFDIRSSASTIVSRPSAGPVQRLEQPDLDRAGAPYERVCRVLRGVLLKQLSGGGLPGENLAYGDGVLVHQTQDFRDVRIENCHGISAVVRDPRDATPAHGRPSEPRGFELGEGLVTWDTGQNPDTFEPNEESAESGVLSSYQLSDGRLQRWQLPLLAISGGGVPSPGVYGYAAHTADSVFWVAGRTIYQVGKLAIVAEVSSIYAAHVR